jgi:uncharacterized protein (TIGR02996 family)
MHDELHFLRAIFNQPNDPLRLIYADWLEDRGDARAEYLRLDVELHQVTKGTKNRRATLLERLKTLQPKLDAKWVAWMRWARKLTPEWRLDLAFLGDGKGLIEVWGGSDETALLVEGKPVALNWDDCHGSIGQYLVFTGHACSSDYVRQMGRFVAGEIEGNRPLADQIEPLLALFATGTYCLSYTTSTNAESIATLECSYPSSTNQELMGYYPSEDRNIVCTQSRESLNENRVAFYCEQIRAQQRPIVLTTSAECAWCEFVIDGHHKLEAYNRQQVKPSVLNIIRWQAPAISLKEGLRFMPRGHRGDKEYRRMKRSAAN